MRPPCRHRTLATIVFVAASSSAQALLIDDFADPYSPAHSVVRWFPSQPDNIAAASGPAAVPGGTRAMQLPLFSGSGYQVATSNFAGSGRLEVLAFSDPGLYLNLGYGQSMPMDLNLSGQAALSLSFAYRVTNALKLTVYATTATPGGGAPDGSAASWDIPSGAGEVLLPLADFSVNAQTGQPVNWGDVDGLQFVFSSPFEAGTLQSFGLETIGASPVPEPAPAALLTLGALAVLAGARRRLAVADFGLPSRETRQRPHRG
jgi:hypothetical protein